MRNIMSRVWIKVGLADKGLMPLRILSKPINIFSDDINGPIYFDRFDPNFSMMAGGMRFVPPPAPMPLPPDGDIEVDEHGNVNWRATWLKELAHLEQVTSEQDKAQVDQEWYRMMLFRVRSALMAPLNPAEASGLHVPGAMPSNPGE
jgi:forkhead box protein J2/3